MQQDINFLSSVSLRKLDNALIKHRSTWSGGLMGSSRSKTQHLPCAGQVRSCQEISISSPGSVHERFSDRGSSVRNTGLVVVANWSHECVESLEALPVDEPHHTVVQSEFLVDRNIVRTPRTGSVAVSLARSCHHVRMEKVVSRYRRSVSLQTRVLSFCPDARGLM